MVQASSALGFGVFGLAVVAERVEGGECVVEVESPGGRCSVRIAGAGPGAGAGAGWCCATRRWRAGCR